jgi:hypothetical protein
MSDIYFDLDRCYDSGQEQLTFSCLIEYENYRMFLNAYAYMPNDPIDRYTNDVTLNRSVIAVELRIFDPFGKVQGKYSCEDDVERISGPPIPLSVAQRCSEIAERLFEVGLTFTVYKELALVRFVGQAERIQLR